VNLKTKILTVLVAFQLIPSTLVYALDVSVLGSMTVSNYSASTPANFSQGTGFGGGATVGLDLAPFFSVETGAIFMNHSTTLSSAVGSSAVSYNYVDVPLWLRISPISFISINAGPYFGINTSNSVSVPVPTDFVSTDSNGNANTKNDFGLMGGVSFRFPVVPFVKLRVDALYELGLVNISTGGADQKSRSFDFLAGVMFDLF
jgi:hypothetical protein